MAWTLWWLAGRMRPWCMSSARVYSSFTGRPIALEICAASRAGSWNSRRPNEPPARMTWQVTAETGRPQLGGDLGLGDDRSLGGEPQLGVTGSDVGDGDEHLEGRVAHEREVEVAADRRDERGDDERQGRRVQASEHVGV